MIEDKLITVTYDSLDELFNREENMKKTLSNYIERTQKYEYTDSEIVATDNGQFKLVLKLKAV